MKILIDGFSLGLVRGTGLTTYSRELANTLIGAGHEVYGLYGLNGLGNDASLLWPRFVQSLGVRGESAAREWHRWLFHSGRYLGHYVSGRALSLRAVRRCERVDASAVAERLPALTGVYNIPSLYRVSQAYSFLCRRPLSLHRPRDATVDLFHRTSPLPLRMRGVANVMTAHDIIPLTLPHSTRVDLRHYRRLMRTSLNSTDRIFVVSEHSRRDIAATFDIPEEKMHVTYQAVDIPETVRRLDPERLDRFLQSSFGLRAGGYFLFYGAIEPKKNVMRILEAASLAHTELPMVIAGKDGWLYQKEKRRIAQLERSGAGKRFLRLEYLPRQQLLYLLRGARALVFPSLYEGFGLPVLEAMQLGIPVITSDHSSLPEVGGDAPLYVDPLDVDGIAGAMERLAEDDRLCAELSEKGVRRAEAFSPARHLARLEEGYRLALA